MQLSKSEYMMFLKHPAWLWLKKHDKAKLPAVDANQQAIFDAGHDFEAYAESLFPDGKCLGFNGYHEYLSLPARTKAAIEEEATVLFQGRLEAENITCIFDILQRRADGSFDLYEIKSSSGVKDDHIYDLAFQAVVAEASGLQISDFFVIHVNPYYIRKGEVKAKSLTVTEKVTKQVKDRIPWTQEQIKKAQEIVQKEECPDISLRHAAPGAIRDWLEIYRSLREPGEESIYNLCRLTPDLVQQLEAADIERIVDIPETIKLKPKQKAQLQAARSGSRQVKEKPLRSFLESLEYPLHFLDYETLADIVPPFDGMRPRQQLPFQYSLHILSSPLDEPEHYEYIHTDTSNPVPALVERLQADIKPSGTILVWYKPFEMSCNDLMGRLFEEYADYLQEINSRVIDLMEPFSRDWYTDHRFGGSASIKNVLPVLAPDLSYKELDIQEGGSAQRLWMDQVLRGKEKGDSKQLFNDLLQYCKLDTLAMVRIYQQLLGVLEEGTESTPDQPHQTALF